MKKITLLLAFLFVSLLTNAQSTINVTTSGGNFAGEKWVSITTAINGGGTQVWGQGNGTYADGSGLINQDVTLTPGSYYVNCYDSYADSWDGTLISVTAYGAVIGDNGGVSPDDGTDTDASGGFNDTQAQELEASFMIVVPNPPSCLVPANLAVSNINATTADLNWIAGASGESAWEYVILLATDPAPTTGTATATTTFNATGLTDATDYVFYVRADCTGGDYSTWISIPFTTYTPIAGDTCDIALPIACGGSETGTTVGATSIGAPAATCGTTSGAPGVWYNFTGNGDIVTASLCNSAYDTKIQVYQGSCGALTCVGGNDDSCGVQSETAFTSVVGIEYYIHVFGWGTSTGAYQLDITCVTPPPPPVNDDCANAVDLTVNNDLNCTVVTAGTIAGGTSSVEPNASCGGTTNNDVWYTFTATANLHNVSLENLVGSTTDMYMSIFEGTCAAFTEVMCSDPESATVAGLTVGTQYTVRVYTWNSDPIADTTFDICVGTPPPPITTDITTYTPEQLITDVLVDADCATVNNIQYETHSLGADIGFSYFTDGGSNFPFAEGVILSSGRAADAAGPFSGTGPSHAGNGLSDTDLENVTGVTGTEDRVYIEFDFIPLAPQISFNYLMASSEYNQGFECNFADSFAFILTNTTTGSAPINLAKLPMPTNGNDTVVVTNIHPEVPGSCPAENEVYFGGYSPASGEMAYGGRTIPLTAFANVIAGDTYHIKLVMADQGDSAFDTAIFLEGGSFSLGSVDLGDDVFLGDPGALCEGDTKVLNAGVLPVGTAIIWYKDGVEIPGETMVNPTTGDTEQILTIDVTGDYSMNIYFISAPDCARENTVHIEFYPNPAPNLGEDVVVCANESMTLNANVENITDPNMGPLNYVWEYNGVVVQNSADSTFVIDATTVVTNTTSGGVQYQNPIDGSTVNGVVSYNVGGTPNSGVYHLGEFTVTATDTVTLCSGTSTFNVYYYENANCILIPTGISPNGDGVNDCLLLDNLFAGSKNGRMQVFNRYGTRVYDKVGYDKEWCGTNQDGDTLVTGTYYYVLDFNNGAEPYKGWVYINTEK